MRRHQRRLYVQLPGADGQPVPEAQATTVASGENFAAGASPRLFGTVRTVINVNPGVVDAAVRGFTHGTLHDTVLNDHDAAVQKTLGTVVIAPGITLAKSASTQGGPAPQTVIYTYTVKNTTTPGRHPGLVLRLLQCRSGRQPLRTARLHRRRHQRRRQAQPHRDLDLHLHLIFNNAGVFTNIAKVCADNIPPAPDNVPRTTARPPPRGP